MSTGAFVIIPMALLLNTETTPAMVAVYAVLASYANEDGECWPSYVTIASRAKISRRSVISTVAALERVGAISIIERKKEDGSQTSNVYRLHAWGLAKRATEKRLGGGANIAPGWCKYCTRTRTNRTRSN